jgi:hypothetical protein
MPEYGKRILAMTPLIYSEDRTKRALLLLYRAMSEISIQFDRIEQERETLQRLTAAENGSKFNSDKEMQERYLKSQNTIMADVHFLFVSLKRLKSCFDRIAYQYSSEVEFKELKDKYGALLKQINHFRNCIEHIDSEADKEIRNLYQINIGESCSFVFDGKEMNIGVPLREEISRFHNDLISAIKSINARRK